ncbi:MAG: phosphate ABC transporter permease PstA [Deltaproteobacteria bacterium]|nr:phosphate ABC transporter permease PstA [Deltaproteobacteria bacterium]
MNKLRKRNGTDRWVALLLWLAAALVVATLLWILGDIFSRGLSGLSVEFLVDEPREAGRAGGLGPVLLSTLLVLGVCMAAAVPVALGAAVLLSEFSLGRRGFGRAVRASLDILAAVPSIVFGLFGNAFFSQILGMGFSLLSGGLTLACMVLPILIRTTEQALTAVPDEVRQGAAAVGLSRVTTFKSLLLPAAAPGLAAGFVLGMGRALAETAALLFTSGYVTRWPESLLDSGRVLSIHIYDLAMNIPGADDRASSTAVVLIALVLLLNVSAMAIGGRRSPGRWSP